MAINLITKYADRIQSAFVKESLLSGRLSTEYSFTGAKTVKVLIPQTVPMNDYARTGANRYGTPQDMQDIVQEMTLTQDKSFSLVIDKGDNEEQGRLKSAAKMLALQLKEQAVPTSDKYGFKMLVNKAGTIVGSDVALTKANIVERIASGTESLDNSEVPDTGRTLFITAGCYKLLRLSPEYLGIDSLGKAAISKGQVGEFDNMAVVKVPASRMPENVNFIIVHNKAGAMPQTLNDTKIHVDPQGYSGNVLEGRHIYDIFVFAPKCGGVYADVTTGTGKGTIAAAPVITTAGAITSTTTGASFKYTTDGSDPRYSESANIGNSVSGSTGTVVKAYAYKAGCFPSSVTEQTLA